MEGQNKKGKNIHKCFESKECECLVSELECSGTHIPRPAVGNPDSYPEPYHRTFRKYRTGSKGTHWGARAPWAEKAVWDAVRARSPFPRCSSLGSCLPQHKAGVILCVSALGNTGRATV